MDPIVLGSQTQRSPCTGCLAQTPQCESTNVSRYRTVCRMPMRMDTSYPPPPLRKFRSGGMAFGQRLVRL